MNWISEHSGAIQAVFSGLTALIWIVYLHALLTNYARQRRPEILITYGAGRGLEASCFVTNLGLEPIYLLDAIVEVATGFGTCRASVTDREEGGEALADPAQATNQGPLGSGGYRNIGTFKSLLERARQQDPALPQVAEVRSIAITIVAATAARSSLSGAERKFVLTHGCGNVRLNGASLTTRQIRKARDRRRLHLELQAGLTPN
ncbi:MAG: hypothetical protein V7668_02260 [Cereibacter changlensis]